MSLSFLYALLISTNSPLALQTHSWIYATSSQQEGNNQEETQTSSENEDGPDETNSESESSQGDTNSEWSESDVKDNDVSSTNQNSNCPNITKISNLPLYIGLDGCQFPCPSFDSNDENNIPEGCPIEPATSQTNTGFSVKEENPTQTPSQEQQQIEHQNSQDSPNQNAFVNPAINSDTSTAVSDNEAPTTTQKSFTPLGKLRSGSTQTESNIPLLSNDVSKPFTPGGGNTGVEGIPNQPNTNPQTPIDPNNIPTKTEGSWAHLTVSSNFTTDYKTPHFAVVCVHTSNPNEIKANPYCQNVALAWDLFYTVQAPGLVGIKVDTNFDLVRSSCDFYIYPKESKSCFVEFFDFKPRTEANKERSFKD